MKWNLKHECTPCMQINITQQKTKWRETGNTLTHKQKLEDTRKKTENQFNKWERWYIKKNM